MKTRITIFVLISVCLMHRMNGQLPVRIDLHDIPQVETSTISHGISPTCYVKNGFIGFRGDTIRPVFPRFGKRSDSLFFTVYSKTHVTERFATTHFVLVEACANGRRNIYPDLNKNMDFTDDGSPIRLKHSDMEFEVWFQNIKNPDARAGIKLIPFVVNSPNDSFTIAFFTGHMNTKGFRQPPPEMWYRNRHLNTKMKDIVVGTDSFRIAVYDYNHDGYFTAAGEDQVWVGPWGVRDMHFSRYLGCETIGDTCMIFHGSQRYYVDEVDSLGRWIDLIPTQDAQNRLGVGSMIPDYTFHLTDGSNSSMHAQFQDGKYMLIDIWASSCAPCIMAIPSILRLDSLFHDQLTILGLASDKSATIDALKEKHHLSYLNGKLSMEILSNLTSGAFPTYILVGPDKKIIRFDTYPAEVEEILTGKK